MRIRQAFVLFVLGTAAAVGVCADSPPPGVRCTLVMGGGGVVTPDSDVNSRWFAINRAVSNGAIAALKSKGYDVREFIVEIQDANRRFAAMARELDLQKCGQVLQITNNLIGDSNSDGRVSSFTFSASVIHLVVGPPTTVVGEYEKTYTYPLTKEVMETLSLSELGGTIAADVDAAKVLKSRTG